MTARSLNLPVAVLQDRYLRTENPNYRGYSDAKDYNLALSKLPGWEQRLNSLLLENRYAEAILFINTDPLLGSIGFYKKIKLLMRTHILNTHYKALLDFEPRLNVQAITSDSNEFSDFIECKLLLILNWYLRGEFHQCLQRFIQLLIDIPNLVDIMENLPTNDVFVTTETILYIVTMCALITIPLDNLDTFIHLAELEQFNEKFNTLMVKARLIIGSKFRRFFKWWHNDMNNICSNNYFLSKKWELVSSTMRQKIYAFYLRISNKLKISYLSEKLEIPLDVVNQEVNQLIREACLNFRVQDGFVYFLPYDARDALVHNIIKEDILLNKKLTRLRHQNSNLKLVIAENLSVRRNRQQHKTKCPNEKPMDQEEIFANSDSEMSNDNTDSFG